MAMIKCKECSEPVSTKAPACPKCGAARPKTSCLGCLVGILGLMLLTFMALGLLLSDGPDGSDTSRPARKRSKATPSATRPERAAATPAEQATPKVYSEGEFFAVEHVMCSVFESSWADYLGDDVPGSESASGSYLLIGLSVSNEGGNALPVPSFRLIDTGGTEFNVTSKTAQLDLGIDVSATLGAGEMAHGIIAFDAPFGYGYRLGVSPDAEAAEGARVTLAPKGGEGVETASGTIVCNRFDVVAKACSDTLNLRVVTDLPDDTLVWVSASRRYVEQGNSSPQSLEYFFEKGTIGAWRSERTVPISNEKWKAALRAEQTEMSGIGLGFDVASVSEKASIRMFVPTGQSDPRFGDRNQNLTGTAVTARASRFVERTVEIDYPLEGESVVNYRDLGPAISSGGRSSSDRWFEGGNLHGATVEEWQAATADNKLATTADWLAGTKWKGSLKSPSDFERLKQKAQMLVDAIDLVASTEGAESSNVGVIAASLITMASDLGP